MIKHVFLAAASVCMLVLAGCNPQAGEAEVRSVLKTACPAAEQAYGYYAAIAASGVLSERTVERVEFAKAQADAVCASPETATVTSVLAAGALVYVRTREAIEEAKARGAVGYAGDLRRLEAVAARIKRGLDHAR